MAKHKKPYTTDYNSAEYKATKRKVVSYLRVSTYKQENEKFKHEIRYYCHIKRLPAPIFVEEVVSGRKEAHKRKIYNIIHRPGVTDIVVPELTRLGRSNLDNLQLMELAHKKGITVHCVKENQIYSPEMDDDSRYFFGILSLNAEREVSYIRRRTQERMDELRRQGMKFGRPAHTYPRPLAGKCKEIIEMYNKGMTKKEISAHFNVTRRTLYVHLLKWDDEIRKIVEESPWITRSVAVKKHRRSIKRKHPKVNVKIA